MSSTLYKSLNPIDINSVRYRVVRLLKKELANYVKRRMGELNKSYQGVADGSRGLISHGTVFNIANERVKEVKETSLRGLASGLEVTFSELARIAYGEQYQSSEAYKSSRFAELAESFEKLPESDKKELITILNILRREIDRRLRAAMNGGGAETGWMIPITAPANKETKDKRNPA
jgi:hypothetical protein